MDEKKIAFISCVDNELYYNECLRYINHMRVPKGYSMEVYAYRNMESICQGYNLAVNQVDAKYKVYLHQDVFILNRNFAADIIEFFENHPKAGMLGVLGCRELPASNRFFWEWDAGHVLGHNENRYYIIDLERKETMVKAIDGMLMVTQYDIPWREDCITGWDFYDFSQSLEFIKNGYEVWIPAQDVPWSLHDAGILNLKNYDKARNDFLMEYGSFFSLKEEKEDENKAAKQEYRDLMLALKENLKELMFSGNLEEVKEIVSRYYDGRYVDTEWVILKNMLLREEKNPGYLADYADWEQAYEEYIRQKFEAFWEKYGKENGRIPEL